MTVMKRRILWLTETAVLLALLIALQWSTKPLGQLVTGSCVNAILGLAVLYAGMGSGVTVALLSPFFAYFLGIAPNLLTVLPIMAGNVLYVLLLRAIAGNGRQLWRKLAAWLISAAAKFLTLYALVVLLICGLASEPLLGQGLLKEPMLQTLPAAFTWFQLFTALIGGGAALTICALLPKRRQNS